MTTKRRDRSILRYKRHIFDIYSMILDENFAHVFSICHCFIVGIIGDSNTLCYNATASKTGPKTGGAIGTACTTASNCLYGLCTNNICSAPPLTCPTVSVGAYIFLIKDFVRHFLASLVFSQQCVSMTDSTVFHYPLKRS